MLALEFSDPGYGRVHFLTVACFIIQHNRYMTKGSYGWNRSCACILELESGRLIGRRMQHHCRK
ncbi:hypothetical protein KZ483_15075 [Paenibacillus sp. sptzw28]|nr:hypothetical protein KZ483_15075 [Paenibacillus sp. sptzw28]